jgi:hypothetical protein
VAIGMVSGGKKLFEILFFLVAYTNLQHIPFTDYFGGLNHGAVYLTLMAGLSVLFGLVSFLVRKIEIQRV